MFHVGRSGSTVVADLLSQHEDVHWDGEVYRSLFRVLEEKGILTGNVEPSISPLEILHRRMSLAEDKFFGCEVKFFHLSLMNVHLQHYIEDLSRSGFDYFIILERRNYLRKIVSSVVAHKVARFQIPHNERAVLNRVRLDVDNVQIDHDSKPLLHYLQDYQDRFRLLESLLHPQNVLKLTYEDDVSRSPLLAYCRVCHFLGIDHQEVSIRHGRMNPFGLDQIVVNFDEVERELRATPFEWMLYE
jgi:hypothetical protein